MCKPIQTWVKVTKVQATSGQVCSNYSVTTAKKKTNKKNLNKFKKRKPIKCNNNYDLLLIN